MRPPFPWNGAKTRLVDALAPYIHAWGGHGRWIEPFLGSGMIARFVRQIFPHTPLLVGDANPWLMAAHRYWFSGNVAPATLLDVSEKQVQIYRQYADGNFTKLSERDRALRFLVCLYSAWGNRWQTNPDGSFATPINTARNGGDPMFLLRRLQESYATGSQTGLEPV